MGPKQLQNLRASALSINSSVAALHVHPVDETGSFVSPGAGSTQVSIKEILSSSGGSLIDSTNVSLGVTIRAGSAAGTEYTDGDVDATVSGQALLFDNSSNTLRPVTIARGLPVNVVAGSAASTTVNISSLAGPVIVRSSAADHLATVYQSTFTDFNTLSRLADRDASTQVAAISNGVPASTAYGLVVRLPAPFIDSTNNALRVFQAASSGASSTEVTVRQSTYTDFNTLSRLADRDASTQVANITNTTPASTAYALAIRQVGYVAPSTGPIAISSIAGRTLVDQNSTAWVAQVSTVAGRVLVDQNSTAWPVQVSTVTGRVLVDQNSTVWQAQVSSVAGIVTVNNNDGSGNALASAVAAPSTSARGLVVRQVIDGQSTTVLITSTHSTAVYSLISSVAGAKQKVYAYFVSSTHTVPSTLVFMSSLAIDRWHVGFGSGSSGMTGANMAVSPPGWIFQADAANALNVRIEGGSSATSTVIARISLSWFSEA